MSSLDRKLWRATENLHDIGQLTALWLEGMIASQPGYEPGCGPDEETHALIPVLARANRAGYVTECSQPGVSEKTGYDGATWMQRAAVEGWVEPHRADELADAAEHAGLIVITHPVLTRRLTRCKSDWIDATRRNGRLVTGFGRQRRSDDVRSQYAECGASTVAAVLNAVQVTIAAPEYGPDQRVWHLLDHWAATTVGTDR
jgi:hypothetical protein